VRVVARNDVLTRLGPWLLRSTVETPPGAAMIDSGRGGAFRAEFAGGLRIVVRPCRRGGWIGRVVERTYFGWSPRPFREVEVSESARGQGVPTPAVLAVRVTGWGFYRGVVVSEEVRRATTLSEALRLATDEPARIALARRAGEAVARLHAAGIDHADLNLTNILVTPSGKDAADAPVQIVDLDKARLRVRPLGRAACRRNVRRLWRSWRRLMPSAIVPREQQRAFRVGYEAVDGRRCAS
jgi:3-deoxy-D-manno-octulosonic acid kinase